MPANQDLPFKMPKHPIVFCSIFIFGCSIWFLRKKRNIKLGSHTQSASSHVCRNLQCCSEHQTEAKNNDGSWDLADLRDLRLIALPRRYNAPLSTFKRHYAESLDSIPFPTLSWYFCDILFKDSHSLSTPLPDLATV